MNSFFFFIFYAFFMVLTYTVRSSVIPSIFDKSVTPEQYHEALIDATGTLLVIYIIMALVAAARGSKNERGWIFIFPLIAGLFDVFLPLIPLIPTIMNILALIFGAMGKKKEIVYIVKEGADKNERIEPTF